MYNSNGRKNGLEFQINTYTSDSQSEPSIAALSDGGFVVCWESAGQDGNHDGIFGQLFDNTGKHRGSEFQVNTYITGAQEFSTVSVLTDGGFIVCWQSDIQDGDRYGIFGQIYDSTGATRGEEFQVNTYTSRNQSYPDVCISPYRK